MVIEENFSPAEFSRFDGMIHPAPMDDMAFAVYIKLEALGFFSRNNFNFNVSLAFVCFWIKSNLLVLNHVFGGIVAWV